MMRGAVAVAVARCLHPSVDVRLVVVSVTDFVHHKPRVSVDVYYRYFTDRPSAYLYNAVCRCW